MKLKDFIKDKLLIIAFLVLAVGTIEIFLIPYPYTNFLKWYIPVVIFGLLIAGLIIEYVMKKSFYEKTFQILDELEEKYLITEIIKEPEFIEGKLLKNILEQTNKSMIENVNKYKYMEEDYKDYIELWIHEIKIPIAASKMIIENNKNKATKSIEEELQKIENYTEQALFYARSNTVEKDYYIKKVQLQEVVNESIRKNKNILMQENISMNLHNLDQMVHTDHKWIAFIMNQIIQNSVKYRKPNTTLQLEFCAKQGPQNVILYIKDNAIGIPKSEITKVFDKGFTGTNGRLSNKKSTGIGLYLCKKLCNKLGMAIELNSIHGTGTEVRLVFPKGSFVEMDM